MAKAKNTRIKAAKEKEQPIEAKQKTSPSLNQTLTLTLTVLSLYGMQMKLHEGNPSYFANPIVF